MCKIDEVHCTSLGGDVETGLPGVVTGTGENRALLRGQQGRHTCM